MYLARMVEAQREHSSLHIFQAIFIIKVALISLDDVKPSPPSFWNYTLSPNQPSVFYDAEDPPPNKGSKLIANLVTIHKLL